MAKLVDLTYKTILTLNRSSGKARLTIMQRGSLTPIYSTVAVFGGSKITFAKLFRKTSI